METLTQTPDTDTLLDDLKRRAEDLKNASVEKFEQFLALFNSNAVEEAPAVADAYEFTENGYATEEAVETAEEIETEEVIAEAPEAAVETEIETVDDSQPQDEASEAVELEASNEEVAAEESAIDLYDENAHDQIQETALQEEIDSAFIAGFGEAPKADIEIRLDEIYSIRVVANEVVSSIEELQNEVTALRAQISTMVSHGELENIVRNIVATTVRDRFAV